MIGTLFVVLLIAVLVLMVLGRVSPRDTIIVFVVVVLLWLLLGARL